MTEWNTEAKPLTIDSLNKMVSDMDRLTDGMLLSITISPGMWQCVGRITCVRAFTIFQVPVHIDPWLIDGLIRLERKNRAPETIRVDMQEFQAMFGSAQV